MIGIIMSHGIMILGIMIMAVVRLMMRAAMLVVHRCRAGAMAVIVATHSQELRESPLHDERKRKGENKRSRPYGANGIEAANRVHVAVYRIKAR